MMRIAFAALFAFLPLQVQAEVTAEYPSAVPTFLDACVSGELSASAREGAILAAGWVEETPTMDVPKFGISQAIERNFDYSKPLTTKQWSKEVDGKKFRAVVATFPEKRRYSSLCAVVVPEVNGAWAYADALKAGLTAIGLKGKSVDLPHYFEYSGKIGPEKRPVRAEVFSRTQAVAEKKSMHLYIAF